MTAAAERQPGERVQMTVSQRDPAALAGALRGWLAGKLGIADPPAISGVRMPASGGLSSTSLLFEADWTSGGTSQRAAYVARMAPEQGAIPVFPRYDLPGQFELIGQVAARGTVPLPRIRGQRRPLVGGQRQVLGVSRRSARASRQGGGRSRWPGSGGCTCRCASSPAR